MDGNRLFTDEDGRAVVCRIVGTDSLSVDLLLQHVFAILQIKNRAKPIGDYVHDSG